ncbi:MAG TPA: phosphoribosyltransferase [Candidatus Aquilonibacter sp.]|nr:phosphoribosyltransferase [Candidatus Aquilonibacter sp.]
MPLLQDRRDAGRVLAGHLSEYAGAADAIVLALPRGGVPVGYEIAHALRLPLDVYIVRKLGVPGHEELAMGALASDGSFVLDDATLEWANVARSTLEAVVARESHELQRRISAYRDHRPEPVLEQKTIIVADDGLATGSSMYAALMALRNHHPRELVVAVPVAPADTAAWLRTVADRFVCPYVLDHFGAVGSHYGDFSETSDDEVRDLLARAYQERQSWSIA